MDFRSGECKVYDFVPGDKLDIRIQFNPKFFGHLLVVAVRDDRMSDDLMSACHDL